MPLCRSAAGRSVSSSDDEEGDDRTDQHDVPETQLVAVLDVECLDPSHVLVLSFSSPSQGVTLAVHGRVLEESGARNDVIAE